MKVNPKLKIVLLLSLGVLLAFSALLVINLYAGNSHKILNDNLDIPWNFVEMSSNPGLNWKMVMDHLDRGWCWDYLSNNKMHLWKEKWIFKTKIRHIKSLQIARHWRNCSCNPQYKLARRLLLKLCQES